MKKALFSLLSQPKDTLQTQENHSSSARNTRIITVNRHYSTGTVHQNGSTSVRNTKSPVLQKSFQAQSSYTGGSPRLDDSQDTSAADTNNSKLSSSRISGRKGFRITNTTLPTVKPQGGPYQHIETSFTSNQNTSSISQGLGIKESVTLPTPTGKTSNRRTTPTKGTRELGSSDSLLLTPKSAKSGIVAQKSDFSGNKVESNLQNFYQRNVSGAVQSPARDGMKPQASTFRRVINTEADEWTGPNNNLSSKLNHISPMAIKTTRKSLETVFDKQETWGTNSADKLKNLRGNPKDSHPWRHVIFAPTIGDEILKKHLMMIHSGLIYSTRYLRGPSDNFLQTRQICLGDANSNKNRDGKRTLVLDLDETLIRHCGATDNPHRVVRAEKDGQTHMIPFKIRPFAPAFLKEMQKHYEIVLFTASMKHYAEAIIEDLDPDGVLVNYILDRAHCLVTKNGYSIKDLRIIKNRDLKDVIIVDNLVHSFGLQLDNGVPILEWVGDQTDTELKHLMDYLVEAARCDDMREFNRERLKLKELANLNLSDVLLKKWDP